MKNLVLSICASVLVFCAVGDAAAGGDSGHGGSIVFVKGKWSLADVFLPVKTPGQLLQLSPEMIQYLNGVQLLLNRYGIYDSSNVFWNKTIYGPFYFVTELPCKDDLLPIEDESISQTPYSCSLKGITYILMEEFNKLDFRSKILGLIHERIHVYRPKALHLDIGILIRGLHKLISIAEKQNSGNRDELTPEDLEAIYALYPAALGVGFGYPGNIIPHMQIFPRGGGRIVYDLSGPRPYDDSVFIGVGSVLQISGTIKSTEIIDSYISDASNIIGSKFLRSRVENSYGKADITNVVSIDSSIERFTDPISNTTVIRSQVGMYRVIADSYIEDCNLSKWTALQNTTIKGMKTEDDLEIYNSEIDGTKGKHKSVLSGGGSYTHGVKNAVLKLVDSKIAATIMYIPNQQEDSRTPRLLELNANGARVTKSYFETRGSLGSPMVVNLNSSQITELRLAGHLGLVASFYLPGEMIDLSVMTTGKTVKTNVTVMEIRSVQDIKKYLR